MFFARKLHTNLCKYRCVMEWAVAKEDKRLSYKDLCLLFASKQGYDDENAKIVTQPPNPEDEEVHEEIEVAKGVSIICSPKRLVDKHLGMYFHAFLRVFACF